MTIFSGEDFDAADHICEVRKRTGPVVRDNLHGAFMDCVKTGTGVYEEITKVANWPSQDEIEAGIRRTATGRVVNDRIELLGKALEQQRNLLTRPIAQVAKCDHEWPEDEQGTDINGSCIKCGMSFMLYVHSECP